MTIPLGLISVDDSDIKERISNEINSIIDEIKGCYPNKRGLKRAHDYIVGLISQIKRKNSRQLAEAIGDHTPYAMQQFLLRGRWNPDEVRDCVRKYVNKTLGLAEAVLVAYNACFPKKGDKSAGTARQFMDSKNRTANCQTAVFLIYSCLKSYAVIDRELYLPREWADNPHRRLEVGVPETVVFRSKSQITFEMLKTAYSVNTSFSWVSADSGDSKEMSAWLEGIRKSYVLAVSGKAYVWRGMRQYKVGDILSSLPGGDWIRVNPELNCRFDWFATSLSKPSFSGWSRVLLVRRRRAGSGEPSAFVCFCPEKTAFKKLVEIADIRERAGLDFEEAKHEVGFGHYEVRSYQGWYKHITMACCAHALKAAVISKPLEVNNSLSEYRIKHNL